MSNVYFPFPALCEDPIRKNPCYRSGCYSDAERCNDVFDCTDGADEYGCK